MDESIRTYALYGEPAPFADLAHCETLQARAAAHDWVIRPHRHARLHQVLLVAEGQVTVTVDAQAASHSAPCLINTPPGCVHGYRFSPGALGYVLTVLPQALPEVFGVAGVSALLAKPVVMQATVLRVVKGMAPAMETLSDGQRGRGPASAALARGLTLQVLALTAEAIDAARPSPEPPRPGEQGGGLFARFEALLAEHMTEGWRVADYARALGASPAQLARACLRARGLSTVRLLAEAMTDEAARRLAYTDKTVSQIAYDLGFDDPAYFARTFRRAKGLSPTAFRQRAWA